MDRKVACRAFFSSLVVFLALALLAQMVLAGGSPNALYENRAGSADREPVEPRDGITVVATQNGDMRDASGELIAFDPNGSVLYHSDARSTYWDVDPVPNTSATVSYVAIERPNESVCGTGPLLSDRGGCPRNVIERVNLSTGEVTRLYAHRSENGRWHDVDRINETHFVVADIGADAAFVVNTTSGIREWTWTAESDLPIRGGGEYGADWTHINDVEHLDDGRVMVDLRNQDQVVFLNEHGVVDEWTLGSDDDHDVLREQHNPDYIPANDGGPAVVVADSENDRLVEYQREGGDAGGTWNRTWTWTDDRMQWPRDADRLPSGNTLVTDTIGDRVFELNRRGQVVWQVHVDRAYEAERLGTGDESAGGPSAKRAGLDSHAVETGNRTAADRLEAAIRGPLPPAVQNGLLGYFFPWWMGFWEVLAVFALVAVVLVWGALELWWAHVSITIRTPLEIEQANPIWSVLLLLVLLGVAYGTSAVLALV